MQLCRSEIDSLHTPVFVDSPEVFVVVKKFPIEDFEKKNKSKKCFSKSRSICLQCSGKSNL